jgi:plastocyanin
VKTSAAARTLGIDQDVSPGEEGEGEVTFPDSGELLFFCKYHASNDIRGGLQVE